MIVPVVGNEESQLKLAIFVIQKEAQILNNFSFSAEPRDYWFPSRSIIF